jgi:hypothetical protein
MKKRNFFIKLKIQTYSYKNRSIGFARDVSTDESIQTGDKRLETGAFASKALNISNPISTKLPKIINFQIVWLVSLYSGEIAFR